jgi:hypothetical protein
MSEILNKIKSNFFSIMLPGFFIVTIMCMTTISALLLPFEPQEVLANLTAIWKTLNSGWIFPIIVVSFSFLVGNAVWAKKINITDNKTVSKYVSDEDLENTWRMAERIDSFPYPMILMMTQDYFQSGVSTKNHLPPLSSFSSTVSKILDDTITQEIKTKNDLKKYSTTKLKPTPINTKEKNRLHSCYNYWKTVLCQEKPDSFALCKEYEARVRLFAGMYWAGFFGKWFSIAGIVCGIAHLFLHQWYYSLVTLGIGAIASYAIQASFGRSLRRVRIQEVTTTYAAYVAFRESQ